jgi:uncharacterized protein YegP (UPF0339 family)
MANFDNYLPCEQYENAQESAKYPGFRAWQNENDGQWYFAAVTNKGRVVLRSEAYTSEAGRDNGIESVLRNRDLEERYSVEPGEDGHWYVVLKAANHQEIARSCPYDSEAAAQKGIKMCFSTYTERSTSGISDNYLPCDYYKDNAESGKYPGFTAWQGVDSGQYFFAAVTNKGRVTLRSEAYTTEAARDNGIESVMKNRDIEERYKVVQDEADGLWYVVLRAGNNQEIARSCPYDSEAAAQKGVKMCFSTYAERSSTGVVDNYLPCDAYAGAPDDDKYPGFKSWFDADTNSHYFAAVTNKGRVTLRSEAYTTEAARDNGIESVMKNRDLEERYKVVQDEADGLWYVVLRAGNNQEIARSCPYDSEAAARAGIAHSFSTYSERAASSGRIEDYLPCEAYHDHAPTSYEGFTQFQDAESGLHYFAMVDKSGKVVLRSEGYTTAKSRDNGIESVMKNRDIEERWSQEKDEDGRYYMSLKAGNRQEIARTCPFGSEGALMGWWMPFAAGAFAWGRADSDKAASAPAFAAAAAPAVLESTPPPPPPPVVVNTKTEAPPPITTYRDADAGAAAGGGDWWKWLLGLLLLAGLLWLLLRGCDGCGKTPPPPPPPPAAAPAPVDTAAKAATPPPPPPAPTCSCSGNADALFNLDASASPKSLTRLGTNPEFGNSHGLSPEQFFQKLQSAAQKNGVDKRFLDRVYKGMGYPEGFAAAKASQFSAVEVSPGTVGNMGYSKAHKTVYARLDAQGQDLLAFRIKSANGCDMHFMKTCGNHFFYCPK